MLKSYFKIAWRNIIKSRFYSAVNIIGLSTGIAFTLLIAAYVWSELQVNKHLKNADRQYIIQSKWKDPNMGYDLATLGPLAKELHDQYPGLVANYYRYDGITSNISKGEKSFRENIQIGDSTLFNMYGFSLLYGDVKTALNEPYAVVVTESAAKKYFGKTDVAGKTITIESFSGSKHSFMITGVLKNVFRNSVTDLVGGYPGNFYVSTSNLNFFGRNMDWNNSSIASYVELQKGVKPTDLEKPIRQLVKQNTAGQVSANLTPYLVPLKEYYVKANNALVEKMIYALSCIAFFILLMAVINFINMSVSRSATRLKEIGIRKVLGGMRKQLIVQFLTESVILVFLATIVSVIIYSAARNFFSNVLGKDILSLSEFPSYFILYPVALALMVGLLAGLYPAFVLSAMKSVDSLKGKPATIKEKIWLRKSLVGLQFAIATVVFIGAIIISQQINYFFSQNLGYNKDYIVSAQVPRDWTAKGVQHMETIRNEFAGMPEIKNVSLSYEIPDGNNSGNSPIYKEGADSTTAITTQVLTTDGYYTSTYDIPMAAGVFYSPNDALTDSFKVVINETEAKAFGWKNPQDAIGQQLKFPGSNQLFTISGVTKDFHFGSMQQQVPPITFMQVKLNTVFRFLSFKIKAGNVNTTIDALQKKWNALMPGAPFEYAFMDDTLNKVYKNEIQLKKAAYTATILSLIIVLLGVLGLISLSIQKRTKEIGIRKVLGSSIPGIIVLFMKEFLWVIFIAVVVACPFAYYIMQSWLADYAYRVRVTAAPFIFSIIVLGIITSLLICLQTIKVALANPVNSLRTE